MEGNDICDHVRLPEGLYGSLNTEWTELVTLQLLLLLHYSCEMVIFYARIMRSRIEQTICVQGTLYS